MISHWLMHVLGIDNMAGRWYGFWSGFGSDIGQVTLIAGLIAFLRHRNCHARGCWRLGRHPVEGTTYVVCRKHHPDPRPTAKDIARKHREHLARKADAPPPGNGWRGAGPANGQPRRP